MQKETLVKRVPPAGHSKLVMSLNFVQPTFADILDLISAGDFIFLCDSLRTADGPLTL